MTTRPRVRVFYVDMREAPLRMKPDAMSTEHLPLYSLVYDDQYPVPDDDPSLPAAVCEHLFERWNRKETTCTVCGGTGEIMDPLSDTWGRPCQRCVGQGYVPNYDPMLDRRNLRSMSMGDIVYVHDLFYLCAAVGWERIPPSPFTTGLYNKVLAAHGEPAL